MKVRKSERKTKEWVQRITRTDDIEQLYHKGNRNGQAGHKEPLSNICWAKKIQFDTPEKLKSKIEKLNKKKWDSEYIKIYR